MLAIQPSERNGPVVAAVLVEPEDEIMLITNTGVLVRTRVNEIREMGRATQGVTLINLDENSRLSGVQRVVESDVDDEPNGDDNHENGLDQPSLGQDDSNSQSSEIYEDEGTGIDSTKGSQHDSPETDAGNENAPDNDSSDNSEDV